MGGYETVKFDLTEDGIAIVRINRPEALNALNMTVLNNLSDLFDDLAEADKVEAVVLTGVDRAFVAGADITYMRQLGTLEGRAFMRKAQAVNDKIESIEKVVIAAVNGFALGGGCELCMACDMRFASEKAKFGQPEVNLGIIPGGGGTQRLPRLVGKGMAKHLIFSAEIISAEEAMRIGLVEKVFPAESLMDETLDYLRRLLSKGKIAIRMAKVAINNGMNVDLRTGIAFEAEAMTAAFSSEDRVEGMSAFLEKRPPVFVDR
jgi:enoyl-CoA hydratase